MIKIFKSKFLRFLISVLLIVFIAFLISCIGNNIKSIDNDNMITVTGLGEVHAIPDIALIDISVLTEAKTVKDAMLENTKKMNSIINSLKEEMKIDEKDIKTTNFNIYPKYEWRQESGERILVGYEISQNINVKIRDLNIAGDITQKVVDLGANNVSNLTFTFDDDEKLKQEARTIAINNAKEKAKILEKDLGIKMVKIVNFSENSYIPSVYRTTSSMKIMEEAAGSAPMFEAGENTINSNVSITYIIK